MESHECVPGSIIWQWMVSHCSPAVGPGQHVVRGGTSCTAPVHQFLMQVDMLQLHGTGTPLGDPIEVGAALSTLAPRHRGAGGAMMIQGALSLPALPGLRTSWHADFQRCQQTQLPLLLILRAQPGAGGGEGLHRPWRIGRWPPQFGSGQRWGGLRLPGPAEHAAVGGGAGAW